MTFIFSWNDKFNLVFRWWTRAEPSDNKSLHFITDWLSNIPTLFWLEDLKRFQQIDEQINALNINLDCTEKVQPSLIRVCPEWVITTRLKSSTDYVYKYWNCSKRQGRWEWFQVWSKPPLQTSVSKNMNRITRHRRSKDKTARYVKVRQIHTYSGYVDAAE